MESNEKISFRTDPPLAYNAPDQARKYVGVAFAEAKDMAKFFGRS
jgi:hypothetical protein